MKISTRQEVPPHVASLDTAFVMLACLVLAEGLIAAFVYHRLGGEA